MLRLSMVSMLLFTTAAACSAPRDVLGVDESVKPRTTYVCVGSDESGAIITAAPSASGTCAPGFDLRPWT